MKSSDFWRESSNYFSWEVGGRGPLPSTIIKASPSLSPFPVAKTVMCLGLSPLGAHAQDSVFEAAESSKQDLGETRQKAALVFSFADSCVINNFTVADSQLQTF